MKLNFVGKAKYADAPLICLLHTAVDGTRHWHYLAMTLAKFIELQDALEKGEGKVDLSKTMLLKEGEGAGPPEEIVQSIKEAYDMQALSDDEMRALFSAVLAEE